MSSQGKNFTKPNIKILSALYGLCKNIDSNLDLNTIHDSELIYLFDIDNKLLTTINKTDAQCFSFQDIGEDIFL